MKSKLRTTLYLLALCFTLSAFTQTQLGLDIDGEAAWEESGDSVSLSEDGNRVAIGTSKHLGNGTIPGHVRVFEYDGTSWSQLGDNINGEGSNNRSGDSVSLSADGSRVAIGAPENSGNGGGSSGHVRVFEYDGTSWSQLGLDIDGEAVGDRSGSSLSLSSDGSRLAIGSSLNTNGNGDSSGHVRIYDYDGTSWSQLGADIDGEAESDQSGRSVSLSSDGSIVAIGANGNDENGNFSGHVRIYSYDGMAWSQVGNDIDGEATGDISGWSVSLNTNGSRLAIGAPNNNGNGTNSGHVRVYEFDGMLWTQIGNDINGEGQQDNSGTSVSLSANGNIIAIGAHLNNGNGTDSGHVRIYEYNGMDWSQLGNDMDGEAANDLSGSSMSLSANGSHVAIGAQFNTGNGTNSGHVRIYDLSALLNVSDLTKNLIYIGPNPVKNELDIVLSNLTVLTNVSLYDITGKLILSSTSTHISTSHLESGLYLVKITTDKGSFTKRLVKN